MNKEKVTELMNELTEIITELATELRVLNELDLNNPENQNTITELATKVTQTMDKLGAFADQEGIQEVAKTPEFQKIGKLLNQIPDGDKSTASDAKAWHKKFMDAIEIVANKYGNGFKRAA